MEHLPPQFVAEFFARERLSRGLDQLIGFRRFAHHASHDFQTGAATVQCGNGRLHNSVGAIIRPDVAPAFQEMGLGHVPLAEPTGLIAVETQVNGSGDFCQSIDELHVIRRSVNRIAAQNDQRVNCAGLHGSRQRRDGLRMPLAIWSCNGRVLNRLTDITENRIESMCGRMDFRRLLRPDRHNAGSTMRLQIAGQDTDELIDSGIACGLDGRRVRVNQVLHGEKKTPRKRRHLTRSNRQSMVGRSAGQREPTLHDVQSIHLAIDHFTPLAEGASILQCGRMLDEQIGIEREDDLGFGQVQLRGDDPIEHGSRAGPHVVVGQRFVFEPLRCGHLGQQLLSQSLERGRTRGFRQDTQAGPFLWFELGDLLGQHRVELGPLVAFGVTAVRDRVGITRFNRVLAAIGIVQRQHSGLRQATAGTQALRMEWVAFDLDRTSVHAGDEQAHSMAVQVERGGKAMWFAGNPPLRSIGERQQLVLLGFAAGHSGQRERSPHDLQPAPTVESARVRRFRKLGLQKRSELRGVVQFRQAAPVFFCHVGWIYRWHVEQLVDGLMWSCSRTRFPVSAAPSSGTQLKSVTNSGGRR